MRYNQKILLLFDDKISFIYVFIEVFFRYRTKDKLSIIEKSQKKKSFLF